MAEMVKLGDVCEILDSQRIPITASNRVNGPYPYYGANGIQGYVDDYIFDDELVLLAEDGGNFESSKRPIAYRVSGKCWVNNHAHVLKPKTNMDVDYLCYSLMFYDVSKLINGSTRLKLTQSAMKEMTVPLVGMNEQNHIVKVLDTISTIIEKRKQQIAMLDELENQLFIEEFSTCRDYVPLSYYISSLLSGKSLAGHEKCQNKVLKTGAATYDYFDENAFKYLPPNYVPDDKHKVRDGDVIISRMNTPMFVGACAYVWNAPENTYIPDRLWKVNLLPNCNPIFIWKMLISEETKRQIRSNAAGTSGTMKNISKETLLNHINVKYVDILKQNNFSEKIVKIHHYRTVLQSGTEKIQETYNALMQQYFG